MNLESHRFPFAVWEWNRVSDVCERWKKLKRGRGLQVENFCRDLERAIAAKRCIFDQGLLFWTEGRQLHKNFPEEISWGEGREWGKGIFIPAEVAKRLLLNLC